MKKRIPERLRREWFLILMLLLIGVCLMMIAGQRAILLVADWSLQANMGSNLDPYSQVQKGPQANSVQPVNPDILIPPVWIDTYLKTPETDDNVPEAAATMVVFDPNAAPSASPSPSSPAIEITPEPNPTVTATPSPSPTPVVTAPKSKEKEEKEKNPPPPPPPPPVPSTPVENKVAVPPQFNVGAPEGNNLGTDIAQIPRGNYFVEDVTSGGGPPIKVEGPAETNYDLVYYEWYFGGRAVVGIDQVIVGISQDPGGNGDPYYQVFNWGDNVPDTNTSLDTNKLNLVDDLGNPVPAPLELDNQVIPQADLYPFGGDPAIDKGVLIDVDNAPSNPPPGDYDYVVIISPSTKTGADPTQVDSIELVEEPPPP